MADENCGCDDDGAGDIMSEVRLELKAPMETGELEVGPTDGGEFEKPVGGVVDVGNLFYSVSIWWNQTITTK